jgi:hypothetical protein
MYAIGDDWYEAMGKPGAMKILGPSTKKKILEHWGGSNMIPVVSFLFYFHHWQLMNMVLRIIVLQPY